jgi:3-mercaptopyruvate sulfurtransferase SseA
MFKSVDGLKKKSYEYNGITSDKKHITYCRTGDKSSTLGPFLNMYLDILIIISIIK